ncbi:hypothetical protein Tco_0080296 [Tanacetum coccineum]
MPRILIPLRPILGVLQIGIRAKVIENQSMHHLHLFTYLFVPEPGLPDVLTKGTIEVSPTEDSHWLLLTTYSSVTRVFTRVQTLRGPRGMMKRGDPEEDPTRPNILRT